MPPKFQNKYRIPSVRASWWDYGRNAAYFVTICTQDRECYFGKIVETLHATSLPESHATSLPESHATSLPESPATLPRKQFVASPIGKIAQTFWQAIPQHFPYVKLDSFIVMPNHMHGIIILDKQDEIVIENNSLQINSLSPVRNKKMASVSPKKGTLGLIIRSYKSAVSKEAHLIHSGFAWQERFYEHIIRNDTSYHIIAAYIINNPTKWNDDRFYIH